MQHSERRRAPIELDDDVHPRHSTTTLRTRYTSVYGRSGTLSTRRPPRPAPSCLPGSRHVPPPRISAEHPANVRGQRRYIRRQRTRAEERPTVTAVPLRARSTAESPPPCVRGRSTPAVDKRSAHGRAERSSVWTYRSSRPNWRSCRGEERGYGGRRAGGWGDAFLASTPPSL